MIILTYKIIKGLYDLHRLDVILHPIRFRIIQRFIDGKNRTAKQLANELKDIAQATLYRQLDALTKNEILTIVEENQIRGTVEKVYALNFSKVSMTNEDVKELSREEHLKYFLFFTAQLTKSFESYLEKEEIDFEEDGVGYRQIALQLSNEEFKNFIADLRKLFEKYNSLPPNPEQKKRLISTVMMPEKEEEQ